MSQNLQLSIAVHLLAGLMSRNDRRETDRQEDIGHSLDVAALLIRESGRRSSPGGHQTPEPRRAVSTREVMVDREPPSVGETYHDHDEPQGVDVQKRRPVRP
jgi:hypothetical protein